MTTPAASALHPTLPTSDEVGRLRRWNLIAMVVQLASAAGVLAIANSFALPVLATWPIGPPGSSTGGPTETLFEIPLAYAVFTFAALSALAHLCAATFGRRRYEQDLLQGMNQLRWLEYSITSTIMVVLIAQLAGIFDVVALLGIAGANVAMILFGWTMDRQGVDRRARGLRADWSSFIFGCLVGIVPWIAMAVYLVGAETVPGFVVGIFVSLFVFFNSFAVVMWAEYARKGPWRRVIVAERSYIILSLTAKIVLTWQVAVNVLFE